MNTYIFFLKIGQETAECAIGLVENRRAKESKPRTESNGKQKESIGYRTVYLQIVFDFWWCVTASVVEATYSLALSRSLHEREKGEHNCRHSFFPRPPLPPAIESSLMDWDALAQD